MRIFSQVTRHCHKVIVVENNFVLVPYLCEIRIHMCSSRHLPRAEITVALSCEQRSNSSEYVVRCTIDNMLTCCLEAQCSFAPHAYQQTRMVFQSLFSSLSDESVQARVNNPYPSQSSRLFHQGLPVPSTYVSP